MDIYSGTVGYVARANYASFNLAIAHRDADIFEMAQGGCLDAVERMPAGATYRDEMFGDVTAMPVVAYR